LSKFDLAKSYSLADACDLVKDITTSKFDASVDICVRLGVDPRKANQMVRGTVALPHGTGKDVRVLVLCTPDKEAEAKLLERIMLVWTIISKKSKADGRILM
jgi:large subunit ribosomal protein L1